MKHGEVRIIGGIWRARRLAVPTVEGLRPTPDRVRETLFNWLAPVIAHAHCLDLFAGSGALGFEALSRGASDVVMVDESPVVISHLKEIAKRLDAKQATIYRARVPEGLLLPKQPFDVVFLDPPYHHDLLFPTCHYLEAHHFLAAHAYIYLEASQRIEDNELPLGWRILKSQRAGAVFYHLAFREKR